MAAKKRNKKKTLNAERSTLNAQGGPATPWTGWTRDSGKLRDSQLHKRQVQWRVTFGRLPCQIGMGIT
jgi:hypothetical protein